MEKRTPWGLGAKPTNSQPDRVCIVTDVKPAIVPRSEAPLDAIGLVGGWRMMSVEVRGRREEIYSLGNILNQRVMGEAIRLFVESAK